ncbi:MAG TPA: hypothetical protein VN851_01020 [Thermoanaerobaculia bacterium]|nr:hypothetical protein [Thermoanaerobaculia bacterium]
MAFAIRFAPRAMSAAQYADTHSHLERAGKAKPAGRLHHLAYGEADQIHVLDIWADLESFQAFGAVLMPILTELGVDPGEPEIRPLVMAQSF